jgi:hypothetical protein
MNMKKIALIIGVLAGFPAAGTAMWWGWSHAVHATVEDKFDNLNAVVIKHQREIEVVGEAVGWLQWTNLHNVLLQGGRLTPRDCATYRRLSKKLGVPSLPC